MKTLQDLFEHQIKDLYNAENKLLKALPKLKDAADNPDLKKAFERHVEETGNHKKRLEEICDELGIKPTGEECHAMEGIIKEAEAFLKEDTTPDVRDAGLIAEAQRMEHYEIAGYGTVRRYAQELGHTGIASKLQNTLDEEYKADQVLNTMAENRLNKEAK